MDLNRIGPGHWAPLRAPAWRAYLYFLLISLLAVAGIAFIFVAGLGSGLLMVTLVGIPLQAIPAALTDAVGWRSLGFLALQAVLMTPIGYLVIVGIVMSGALGASPVVWWALGEPFVSLGEPVDSLGSYLLLSAGGVAGLYGLGWLMLGLGRAHAWLARALPMRTSSTIRPPLCAGSSAIFTTARRLG